MYIYMYIYIYIYAYIYICIYILHTYIDTYIYMYLSIYLSYTLYLHVNHGGSAGRVLTAYVSIRQHMSASYTNTGGADFSLQYVHACYLQEKNGDMRGKEFFSFAWFHH